MLTIYPIPAFKDNYIWCLHNRQHAVVVDPGDAEAVMTYLSQHALTLTAILITHHHWDHTDGLPQLLQQQPNLPVYGPQNAKISGINQPLSEHDSIQLTSLDLQFNVLEVPGHTLDHIAYYDDQRLFCGDTLFSAGCGRMFEGKPAQMAASLAKLAALPAATKVYCTHEYTLANLAFAQTVEPGNNVLAEYTEWAKAQRKRQQSTLPSDIAKERAINPFLRLRQAEVKSSLCKQGYTNLDGDEKVFAALRNWKDNV